jgi:hypothetical protein
MKTGDRVKIECAGRRVDGTVILASENGASLMLAFEALLDGHVGMMPVLRGDDGSYRAIMTGSTVEIIPA